MTTTLCLAFLVLLSGCAPEAEPDGRSTDLSLASVGSREVTAASGHLPAPADTGTVARRILADPAVDWLVSPTPDGRRIARTDWTTGDLAVRDLETGEDLRLTEQPEPYAEGFVLFPRYAPDGGSIAYGWWNAKRPWEWQLRVVDADGGEPRVLVEGVPYIQPDAWSPDGRTIAAVLALEDATHQIVLVDADEGTRRSLRSLDWRAPGGLAFSPDGRWIAYDFPPEEDDPQRDIYVVAASGGEERAVVQHPGDDRMLGWAPTGHLLFHSHRTGTPGAWLLAMEEGRAQGDPELVKPDLWRAAPVGFTADGTYFYGVQTDSREVHTAALDPETGRVTGPPSPAGPRGLVRTERPRWSPDGRYLAYRVQRGPLAAGAVGTRFLAVRSLETGEVRELPPDSEVRYLLDFRWSPDGSSLIVRAQARSGRAGLYRTDPLTGRMELLFDERDADASLGPFDLHPDGRRVVHRMSRRLEDGRGEDRLILRDLTEESERTLVALPPATGSGPGLQLRHPEISPDGRRLAYLEWRQFDENLVKLMPLEGGEPRAVFQGDVSLGGWTGDGRSLLMVVDSEAPESREEAVPERSVVRLDPETGRTEPLGVTMDGIASLHLHPDGRRLAFTAGANTFELWTMEGFLPETGEATAARVEGR